MKRDLLAVGAVCAVVCIFCQEILLGHMSPFRGDIPLQFYPWKAFTLSMLSRGELPYWNPYTYGGAPFLANMQSAVFYPLDLILFLFPLEWFFGLSLVLHLLLAAVGAYCLARKCGASSPCAVLAGIAYGLNGFTMIHIPAGNHLTYAGAAWVPWMFYVTAGFVLAESGRLRWLLAGSIVVLLHFLCGHPQMTFYSLFFSILLCLALSIARARNRGESLVSKPMFRTGFLGLFFLLGIALAGIQLLPTLEYMQQANRAASLDLQMATEFSFAPHRLITLFLPEYYGTKGFLSGDNHYDFFYFWSNAYAGLIIPLLAVSLFRRGVRPAAAIPLAAVGLLGLFFAWGRGNPAYALLFELPGFGHFRAPAKFLPYYLVPVCTLAALAVDRLAAECYDRQQQRTRPSAQPAVVWNVSLVFLLVIILFVGYPGVRNLYEILRLQTGFDAIEKIRMFSSLIGGILLLCAIALYLFASKASKPRLALAVSFSLLLSLDLFAFGRGYLLSSLGDAASIQRISLPPENVRALQEAGGLEAQDRIATLEDLYFPNYCILWRLNNLAGYDPLSLEPYNRLIGEMESWPPGSFHDNIQLRQSDHPTLDRLNVRYILTRQNLASETLREVSRGKVFAIYERLSPSRAWASTKATTGSSETESPAKAEIQLKSYDPHRIEFDYRTSQPTRLTLSEWAYPGWRAEAGLADDSKAPVAVQASEDGFRVLDLPENVQRVSLYYQAPRTGWFLSLLSLLMFGCLVVLDHLFRTERLYGIVQRLMGRYY